MNAHHIAPIVGSVSCADVENDCFLRSLSNRFSELCVSASEEYDDNFVDQPQTPSFLVSMVDQLCEKAHVTDGKLAEKRDAGAEIWLLKLNEPATNHQSSRLLSLSTPPLLLHLPRATRPEWVHAAVQGASCNHYGRWKRLRSRNCVQHLVCTQCGVKWTSPCPRSASSQKG